MTGKRCRCECPKSLMNPVLSEERCLREVCSMRVAAGKWMWGGAINVKEYVM